ncbi:MAG: PQQ-binding-like beta-propeller repeat protein [Planctomycetota bacterium]
MNPSVLRIIALVLATTTTSALAEDWPTYRHDARRSGVTTEALSFPLRETWVRRSKHHPQTAWTGPAKWDAYSGNRGLQSMRNFDPCFYVTASGDQVFYGSSVDDAVHALDAESGEERWVFFTDSAVRFPPSLDQGRAYFGSDDGHVYCCGQENGDLIWKLCASAENRYVTSNRKLLSMWPIRTGVLLQGGKAIFGASLVPWEPSYLLSVSAVDGKLGDQHCFHIAIDGVTLQGALLASSERIYVPQGRAAPLSFDLNTGNALGAIGEAGGVFCVLTEDEMLLAGPQTQKESTDQIRIADAASKRRVATFGGTNRILVDGAKAWIPSGGKLKMLDRAEFVAGQLVASKQRATLSDKKLTDETVKRQAQTRLAAAQKRQADAWQWEVECPPPHGFVKAGSAILVGLDGEVRAYGSLDGKLLWVHSVEGVAHGLAVANGRLFVSTGLGHIYAFTNSQ